jgi:hypothetical protein
VKVWRWLLGIIVLVACTFGLTAIQTSLWFLIMGSFPPPLFWLMMLIYVALTRSLPQAIMYYYLLTMVISSFTVFPFEHFLLMNTIMLMLLLIVKGRIFWPGTSFYVLACGASALIAPLIFWTLSRLLDKNPLFMPEIFSWLVSALMTMLVSMALYNILRWFDRILLAEGRSENIGANYE